MPSSSLIKTTQTSWGWPWSGTQPAFHPCLFITVMGMERSCLVSWLCWVLNVALLQKGLQKERFTQEIRKLRPGFRHNDHFSNVYKNGTFPPCLLSHIVFRGDHYIDKTKINDPIYHLRVGPMFSSATSITINQSINQSIFCNYFFNSIKSTIASEESLTSDASVTCNGRKGWWG